MSSGLRHLMAVAVCGVFLGCSPAIAQNNQIDIEQFDSWIFNQHGSEDDARDALNARIDLKIRRIEQSVTLSDPQERALRLAAQGDVNRFFNRVAHARSEFQQLGVDQNDVGEAFQLAQPLQQELVSGLFGRDSLFSKVLRASLDPEQREELQRREEIRSRQQFETHVKSYVSQLEMQLPMTAAQRERLVALATEKVTEANPESTHFYHLLRYHISQLPDEETEKVFDAGQLRVFRKIQAQNAAMAPFLRQQGLLNGAGE